MLLGNNIQNWAIPQNSTSISGEIFILRRMQTALFHMLSRVSQCAVMLNYGEPQILELLKNTLYSRLYPMLFPIKNLRDAVTTVKWVMIKEKIDQQKTGQSSATPFMKMNDCNQTYKNPGKKGVTFDAMETFGKTPCDSIDRLTSLVSKMNVKMDKKETPYKPKVYQNRHKGQGRGKQSSFQPLKLIL